MDLTIVVYRETDYVMHKFLGLKDIDGGVMRGLRINIIVFHMRLCLY